MTLPRSSGCTRTSSTRPRRSPRLSTWTSSGCSTIPLTRCSRASSSMSGAAICLAGAVRSRLSRLRSLGRLRRLARLRSRRLRSRRLLSTGLLSSSCRLLSCRLLSCGRLSCRRLSWRRGLVGLGLLGPGWPARGPGLRLTLAARQALELLPVAGDLEDLPHRVGRLRADGQPVLDTLAIDLDERRLGLG